MERSLVRWARLGTPREAFRQSVGADELSYEATGGGMCSAVMRKGGVIGQPNISRERGTLCCESAAARA